MILIDVPAFAPPGVDPSALLEAYRALYPADEAVLISNELQRIGWLRRLRDEPVYSKFAVLTTPDFRGFAYWSCVGEQIQVTTPQATRSLPKTARRTPLEWALTQVTGLRTKGDLKRAAKDMTVHDQAMALLKQLGTAPKPEHVVHRIDGTYELVTTETFDLVRSEILAHIKAGGLWAWDTETEDAGEDDTDAPSSYHSRIVGVSFAIREKHAWYFPIRHRDPGTNEHRTWNLPEDQVRGLLVSALELTSLTTGPGVGGVIHNAKYDLSVVCNPVNRWLTVDDVYLRFLPISHCTMLLAALVCERFAGLKPLAEEHFNAEVVDFKKLTNGKSFAYVDAAPATIYAGQDSDWALRLFPILKKKAEELEVWSLYADKELPLIEYFMRMERRGVRVNKERLETELIEYRKDVAWKARAFSLILHAHGVLVPSDFKINSNEHLAQVLFAEPPRGLGLPVLARTLKTNVPATDEKTRNKLKASGIMHPALRALDLYKEAQKILTAYLEPIPAFIDDDTSRVHANFHQVQAATGRTSVTHPALQTIPDAVRTAFEAEEHGQLASLDYSQIELRVLAAVAGERKMLAAFARGEDIHAATQRDVGLPTRTLAKNFNFGVSFGAGAVTLSDTAGVPIGAAKQFLEQYWFTYQDFRRYIDTDWPLAQERGWIRNWAGRLRVIPPAFTEYQEAANLRMFMNTPIQGGALDIIKLAMLRLLPLLRIAEQFDIHPWNMVHDDLSFEHAGPPEERWIFRTFLREVAEIMEAANPFNDLVLAPVDLKYGHTWAEC